MYCYCIEKKVKSKGKKKNPLIKMAKNGSHFEHFWVCLQVFVLWGLAGMYIADYSRLQNGRNKLNF